MSRNFFFAFYVTKVFFSHFPFSSISTVQKIEEKTWKKAKRNTVELPPNNDIFHGLCLILYFE